MKAKSEADELRPEYDFTAEDLRRGVRGKYAAQFAQGTNLVPIDADVAEVFPNAASVNEALRALRTKLCSGNVSDLSSEQYHAAFNSDSREHAKRKAALEQALDIRKFEIGLYWTRASYFWTFIGAALVAYGAVRTLGEPEKSDFSVFVSCLGFLFSFAWYCVNRGSKFWHENWENHVDLLEDTVTGPLYKTVISRAPAKNFRRRLAYHITGPHPFSVSKINQITSLYISSLWCFLLWYSLPPFSLATRVNWEYMAVVLLTIVAAFTIVRLGGTHGGDHKIVARQRETRLAASADGGSSLG